MPRDRKRQRANKAIKRKEEALERKNSYGYQDLTAHDAVNNIIKKEKKIRGELKK